MGFQLFWAAFNMLVTVVPLKEALGWEKMIFGHLKIMTQVYPSEFFDYFFEMPKNQIFPILMQLLMVPLSWADQNLPKTIDPPI